jgi:indoleamine 2,3-dioxygenase
MSVPNRGWRISFRTCFENHKREGKAFLIDHLADMRRFMPKEHRQVIEDARQLPSFREIANKETYNDILEAMATFREVHYGWADEYINRRVEDPRGTGGTPYMQWLKQLVDESRAHMID